MRERVKRRAGLADFLQNRRARLHPEQFHLPIFGRRRTRGLRREELAQLVGVGVSWYTWLEQGRDIPVSDHDQPPVWAVSRMGCIAGEHFTPQPDGTLQCPAGFPLYPQERRPERDGSVRVVYAARIGHCRPFPRREECQGYGAATRAPRRVSAVLWPLDTTKEVVFLPPPLPAPHPLVWGDWQRCFHRREVVKLLRHQRVEVELAETAPPAQSPPIRLISRAERAHWRLSWAERLARNARRKPLQRSQSGSLGYQTPLLLLLAFASPEPEHSLTSLALLRSLSGLLRFGGPPLDPFLVNEGKTPSNPHNRPSPLLPLARCASRGHKKRSTITRTECFHVNLFFFCIVCHIPVACLDSLCPEVIRCSVLFSPSH